MISIRLELSSVYFITKEHCGLVILDLSAIWSKGDFDMSTANKRIFE